jgi:ABC-type cobalamin/Fe3+-siderophores transport system ATPase subunit
MANFTEEQLAALQAIWAGGASSVKYADKEVAYVNSDELARRMATIEQQLGRRKNGGRVFASTSKGLD